MNTELTKVFQWHFQSIRRIIFCNIYNVYYRFLLGIQTNIKNFKKYIPIYVFMYVHIYLITL